MKNALVLHGTGRSSQSDWLPWLEGELLGKGYKVWVPDLPDSWSPNLEVRSEFIFKKWQFNKESIIIGHSSGGMTILGLLDKLPKEVKIDKAILVAGFARTLGFGFEVGSLGYEPPVDLERIGQRAKKFIFIYSDNDPFNNLGHGRYLEEKLGGKLIVMSGQGHFDVWTMGEKYRQFPELLKYI